MTYCLHDEGLGKIEVRDLPLPKGFDEVNATYTHSGRILLSRYLPEDQFEVYTVNDDGSDLQLVFAGAIPQKKTANGIRWMVYQDNRRVLLGDYVLEASPDLDHPALCDLVPVIYPKELMTYPMVFRHWSEIIISPDGESIVWTMLTFTGAHNFIGTMVREKDAYVVSDVCCISTIRPFEKEEGKRDVWKPLPVFGGETKQFIRGGKAISLVGNSDSISDSVIEDLASGTTEQFSHTAGYEETAIFSPDETLAICMSTRFSPTTNCAILGQVPLPHSMFVRSGIINAAYNYAIGSNRVFRMGNIGPALVDAKRTVTEGRSYQGVDLSDPENVYVYVSPLSFAPCSTKALVNMHTRKVDPVQKSVVRVVTLLDRKPAEPKPLVATPKGTEIPQAIPLEDFLKISGEPVAMTGMIEGEGTGSIINSLDPATGIKTTRYEHYSVDGKTFYDGTLSLKAPASIFAAGDSIFTGDLTVTGEHTGRLFARIWFSQKTLMDPVDLASDMAEDGKPKSYGYAEYDHERVNVEDMK